MNKVCNFRDLGGLPTTDGRRIKSGLLFRSGMLDDADENDISTLKQLGVRYIFDYRDHAELPKNLTVSEKIGAKRLHFPSFLNIEKIFKLQKEPKISNALKRINLEDIADGYKKLPFGHDGYSAMFAAVKEKNVPLLQHCSAGKDRAGMGSAILLTALGVPYEEVLKDYLKSLEAKEYIKKRIAEHIPFIFRPIILKRYEPLFIVDKTFLDSAFGAIDEKYGSFDNYLLNEFSLTASDVREMRDFYTE